MGKYEHSRFSEPLSDADNEARFLGDPNELSRRKKPALECWVGRPIALDDK